MLLQLSVLGIFTLEEASLLCEDASAPDALRNMMHGNSFLTYDQSLDSYRFHSILQSYLLARLEENVLPVCRSIDRKKLYRRAGECVSQRGDLLQAIRHFKQAGEQQDLARILHFFELPRKDIFVTFDPEGIKNIVDTIPWEIRCLCPLGYLGFIHQ